MTTILEQWDCFKEAMTSEVALDELEKALGTNLLTEHIEFIMRMYDWNLEDEEESE